MHASLCGTGSSPILTRQIFLTWTDCSIHMDMNTNFIPSVRILQASGHSWMNMFMTGTIVLPSEIHLSKHLAPLFHTTLIVAIRGAPQLTLSWAASSLSTSDSDMNQRLIMNYSIRGPNQSPNQAEQFDVHAETGIPHPLKYLKPQHHFYTHQASLASANSFQNVQEH